MTGFAGKPTVRECGGLASWELELWRVRSPVRRYGLSVGSVAMALGLALVVQHYGFGDVAAPLFALAIAFVRWHAGLGPAAVAVALSTACFTYFFTPPPYSFEVNGEDLPYFIIFVVWAVIVAWFVALRRRIENMCWRPAA
jgi:K+-sensing histidine kinase KdpD